MDLEHIWSRYRASLKAFLHGRVADPAEVDDLLQEILLKTHSNLHTIRSEASVKAWLFQVANRAIIDFYRRRGRAGDLEADDLWYGAHEQSIEGDLAGCIEPFIDALPPENAALLRAVDLEGESQKAYAKAHGISYSTLKSRVQKSRAMLRGVFDNCCSFTLDQQGRLVDFEQKPGACTKKC